MAPHTQSRTVLDKMKDVWGANQSRGFKLASWGAALLAFAAITQYQKSQEQSAAVRKK